MKLFFKAVTGISLGAALALLSTAPSVAEEIEWIRVPGTLEENEGGGQSVWLIGENTISRNGEVINFDILEDAHFSYTRVAGNCRTGWLNIIALGYIDEEGQVVIYDETQAPFNVQHNKPDLTLEFACTQSE